MCVNVAGPCSNRLQSTHHSRLTLAWDHGPRSCSGDEKSRDGGATRAHRDPDIRQLTAVRKWISWRFGTRMARERRAEEN